MSENVSDASVSNTPDQRKGVSDWVLVTQEMITRFGDITLDPDPMHVDPEWSKAHSPFGGCIAFGFLTLGLLTHMVRSAWGAPISSSPHAEGTYLNYGFDRVRLITPVHAGSRIRGHFTELERRLDEQGRWKILSDCRVEIEHEPNPALVAVWLSLWIPPNNSAVESKVMRA